MKKSVWMMAAVLIIGVGSALLYRYNQHAPEAAPVNTVSNGQQNETGDTPVKQNEAVQDKKSGSADNPAIPLPWLTREHLAQGRLDDTEIGIGTTAAELRAALGQPDRIDNYEGIYYGYQDAAFFFPRSTADEIKDDDPVVKIVLNVQEHQLTRAFLNQRFGPSVDEGLMESTGDYLIFYNVGSYTLGASPDEQNKNRIIGLELSPKEK
ncbi:DUF4309 domain-containing protein [Paenibacillus wulumuqiensis]|uniref:DUF4309 domain-containing protein n=1 Tax=Paenibacillus wulumuqiensis TaxID=1567107 RepID=UPI0006191E8C|nr:DUF4309 domain-containing protein [Paenibacillus wulumuqiensis]